jgi:hypothetical protein
MILHTHGMYAVTVFHFLPGGPITVTTDGMSANQLLADIADPMRLLEFPGLNGVGTVVIPSRSIVGVQVTPETTS